MCIMDLKSDKSRNNQKENTAGVVPLCQKRVISPRIVVIFLPKDSITFASVTGTYRWEVIAIVLQLPVVSSWTSM